MTVDSSARDVVAAAELFKALSSPLRVTILSSDSGVISLNYALGRLDEGFYVRLRGSDGNRLAAGLNGASVDPSGPALDLVGDADPWNGCSAHQTPRAAPRCSPAASSVPPDERKTGAAHPTRRRWHPRPLRDSNPTPCCAAHL